MVVKDAPPPAVILMYTSIPFSSLSEMIYKTEMIHTYSIKKYNTK